MINEHKYMKQNNILTLYKGCGLPKFTRQWHIGILTITMLANCGMVNAQETADSVATDKTQAQNLLKKSPKYSMQEIRGKVLDAATRQPIVGAHIQAFNNNRYSALTDEEGKYTIKVPTFATSLFVSAPEYNDIQVAYDGMTVPTVFMYSSKFNSIYSKETSVTAEKSVSIENASVLSVDGSIENMLGGDIRTINRCGIPGQGVAMFIRGINSLNLNSQPLVILDGIIMDMQLDRTSIHNGFFNNVLAAIDPEDIENVQVLKNATALYGSRGANGAVIITTKRGHSMATSINLSVFGGFELTPKSTKVMNASQYRNYTSELIGTTEYGIEHSTVNTSIPFLNDNPQYYWYPMYHNDTDWSDGLYRNAFTQNYKVNVQGGDDVAMYNLSLGYSQSQATAKDNDFNRLNIRFNTDINLIRNLSTQLDVSYSRLSYDLRDNGWAESYADSPISSPNVLGLIQTPFLSKFNYYTGDDAKLHLSSVYSGKNYDDDNYPFDFASRYGTNTALANPYWILKNGDAVNKNNQEVTQFNLNVMPKWQINRHLFLTNRFAYQLNRASEKYYLPIAGIPVYNLKDMGDVTGVKKSLFDKETSLYEDLRLNWANNYGKHDIAVFGGFRFTSNSFTDNYETGYNIPGSGSDKMPDNKSTDSYPVVDGTNDAWKNLAYYAHANYAYKNTYIVDATVTAESSSRFGNDCDEGLKMFGVTWGIFPSIQFGWVITNEPWMKKTNGINYLKLTAGYDITGNDNIDYSASRTYYQATTFLKSAIGLQLKNIENPKLQWETTKRWNFGINGSFVNNRIQAGLNVYVSNTDNLITPKSINYLAGLDTYWCNGGALRNIGAEVNINTIIINSKSFKWQLGATLGHYKNKITSLPEDSYIAKVYGGEILTSAGNPAGVFFGYRTNGVFATDAEASQAGKNGYLQYPTGIQSRPYNNFNAGDIRFTDITNDGFIDDADKTIIGDPNPDIYGNIYTNFILGKFALDFTFKYSLGNDIYNYQRSQLESLNGFYNQSIATVNRWTCEGQQTDMPRACTQNSDSWVNNERFSDRWIEDGSFLKLKNVRLTYQLPVSLSWMQGITIWAEANNLFTITKYSGNDPESSCSGNILYQGIDTGMLPSNRSFNIGIKLNL